MPLPDTPSPKRSTKKSAAPPQLTTSQQSLVGAGWMDRADALDLLVRTACSLPWHSIPESTSALSADVEAHESPEGDTIDPLLLQGDTAIDLICRCELLLARRKAEFEIQTVRLAQAQESRSAYHEEEWQFEVSLRDILKEPQATDNRFSYAQVRRFLTGHDAAQRGDDELREIWVRAKGLNGLPRRFDLIQPEAFASAVDSYVRVEGLAASQLKVLEPLATKLAKKKNKRS
jgi:hypothetical protein